MLRRMTVIVIVREMVLLMVPLVVLVVIGGDDNEEEEGDDLCSCASVVEGIRHQAAFPVVYDIVRVVYGLMTIATSYVIHRPGIVLFLATSIVGVSALSLYYNVPTHGAAAAAAHR
eukprot:s617_g1.t1